MNPHPTFVPTSDAKLTTGSAWLAESPLRIWSRPSSLTNLDDARVMLDRGSFVTVVASGHVVDRPQHEWIYVLATDGITGFINRTHFVSGSLSRV